MARRDLPHVRVEGTNPQAARIYFRAAMHELWKTEEVRNRSGVHTFKRNAVLDEYTSVIVKLHGESRVVIITCNLPTGEEAGKEEERKELDYCTPGFVIYARKRHDGSTNQDYVVAYNKAQKAWMLARVDPYLGCSNTGYWGAKKGVGVHTQCDLVTWDGQAGGFGDMGHETLSNGTQYDNHKSDFYIGGYKISSPGIVHAAWIGRNKQGDYKYFCLTRSNFYLYLYEGGLAAPNASGAISPSWTLNASFDYRTYVDVYNGNEDEYWPNFPGNPHVSEEGTVFFTSPLTKRVEMEPVSNPGVVTAILVNHLFKIDFVEGTLTILETDLDNAPDQSAYYTDDWAYSNITTGTDLWRVRPDGYDECSSDSASTAQGPMKPGNCTGGHHNQTWGASYSNKGRPMLLRSFGGLDSLYTYEMEIEYSSTGTFNSAAGTWQKEEGQYHTDAQGCIPGYQTPHNVRWHCWSAPVVSTKNVTEIGEAVVHCYDRGDTNDKKTIIDSLVVWELDFVASATENWLTMRDPLNETMLQQLKTMQGGTSTFSMVQPSIQPSTPGPSGLAVVNITRRTIIDHHPQIKDSWVYIETIEKWNPLTGVSSPKRVIFVDMLNDVREEVTGTYKYHRYNDPSLQLDPYTDSATVPAWQTGISRFGVDFNAELGENIHLDYKNGGANDIPAKDYGALNHYGFYQYLFGNNLIWNKSYFGTGYQVLDGAALAYGTGYNAGTYGTAIATSTMVAIMASTNGTRDFGNGWNFTGAGSIVSAGSVAVHRTFGTKKTRPYIWIKRKMHSDTQSYFYDAKNTLETYGQAPPIICGSESSPYDYDVTHTAPNTSWYYVYGGSGVNSDDCIFWTRGLSEDDPPVDPEGRTHYQILADEGEWFIESNILSDQDILYLTKELSLDCYSIGVI